MFSPLMVTCEYKMKFVNEVKKRKLNGKCDYTICRRGHRIFLTWLLLKLKWSTTNRYCSASENALLFITKEREICKSPLCMVFIQQGRPGYSFFINQDGVVYETQAFPLNIYHYVKGEFNLIYRLVHYVVEQSYL